MQPQAAPLTESGRDLAAEPPGTPASGPGPVAPAKPEPPGKTEIKLQPEAPTGPTPIYHRWPGFPRRANTAAFPSIRSRRTASSSTAGPNPIWPWSSRAVKTATWSPAAARPGSHERRDEPPVHAVSNAPGRGWPVVGLDVGGIAKGFGRQAELKFQIAVEAMRKTGYDAIGLGTADLQLPTNGPGRGGAVNSQPTPFLSASVGLFAFDEATLAQTKIVSAGGRKVGVTAVLGKGFQGRLNNADGQVDRSRAGHRRGVPN